MLSQPRIVVWHSCFVERKFVPMYTGKDVLLLWCDCVASKWIVRDFTSPPSKTEVSRSSFPTQCYVDVHKAELYGWIIQIIVDNSERHVCVSVQWQCRLWLLPSSAFVTDAGSIILQMPWNMEGATQKEKKKIIAAYALSQNASLKPLHLSYCFWLYKKKDSSFKNIKFMMPCTK
jgi:hypothetical protein